jgi:hypothetical protein
MFSDLYEIEYINTHNMHIFKEDISYEHERYLFESESVPPLFESESVPPLFESEFKFESESVPPLFESEFKFESESKSVEHLFESEFKSEQEKEDKFELTPFVLIKQLHMKYNNQKINSVKRYNRGKLHYLTPEEKIIRRREFNRLYAANSRARKQQMLKEQTEMKN